MNATIVHRGPDGAGVLVDGPTAPDHAPALHHRSRRWLATHRQRSWRNPRGPKRRNLQLPRVAADNWSDLGHRFRTNSDTETLVHAYEQWGNYFPQHLRGMFAFAIWDRRRQAILIGRDRLGIKPLYYTVNSAGLLFASELSSIVASPLFEPQIDLEGLQQFLTFGSTGFDALVFAGSPTASARLHGRVQARQAR